MKKQFLIFAVAVAATTTIISCKKEAIESKSPLNTSAADISITGKTQQELTGVITVSDTLTNDKVWVLDEVVAVSNNSTLTIEAGTIIVGKKVEGTKKPGALIITKGSKIIAIGTDLNPIVFTSWAKVDNNNATAPTPGDFGGIILCGKADVNQLTNDNLVEGIDGTAGAWSGYYGGTDAADNSGTMQYVRSEYAGYAIETDKEINSFTFAGVGSGTTLDHLEAYYGKDDAFEFFGGNVNASYLLAIAPEDDGLDFDNGYTGTISNAVVIMDLAGSHTKSGTSGDSNGIECDNDSGSSSNSPITKPFLNAITVIGARVNTSWNTTNVVNGGGLLHGARFRRNTDFHLQNSIIIGFANAINLKEKTTRRFLGQDQYTGTKLNPIQKVARTSFAVNNYFQAFSTVTKFESSTANDDSSMKPVVSEVTDSYLTASYTTNGFKSGKNLIDASNTVNSNINVSSSKTVFVQPFVNANAQVNLNLVKGGAALATQGHLAKDMTGTKANWGKNWMLGVYGF